MRRLLKLLVVIVIVIGIAAAAMAYVIWPTAESVVYVSPLSAKLEGSDTAGKPLNLVVEMAEGGGPVEVFIFSGGSVFRFDEEFQSGRWSWTLPEAVTDTAGHLTVLVGEHQLGMWRSSGDAAQATEVLLGPRTIVADGRDLTLAVVTPGDVYGNAIRSGAPVVFQRLGPMNQRLSYPTTVSRSLAWTQLVAGTEAGANSIWATVFRATGLPAILNEVPGFASSVELDLETSTFAADGRQVIELETGPLVDAFGNELPDGVAGVFRLTTSTKTTVVPATVQRGRLRAWWTAPNSPEILSIEASVNGQTSESQAIEAVGVTQAFSVRGHQTEDGYRVDVGPILDTQGALIADGTEVMIGNLSTTTTDGLASALVQPEPGILSVTVLGRTVEHRIEP